MSRLLCLLLTATLVLGCSKKEETAAVPSSGQGAVVASNNAGKVLQLLSAAGYTYAEVETAQGKKIWVAGSPIQVKAGDVVQWADAAIMRNFASKSLGRTFDEILFVSAWGPQGGMAVPVAPHGTPPGMGTMGMNMGGGTPMAGGHPPMAAGAPMAGGHPPMAGGGHPPMNAMPGAASATGHNQGQVKTIQTAGGYVYLEVTQGAQSLWVAAPETAVKAGDTVRWEGGSVMNNFTARSLNRTFDSIVFASGVAVVR